MNDDELRAWANAHTPVGCVIAYEVLRLLDEKARLREAIGCATPSLLRVFIQQTNSDIDRGIARRVLDRIERAVRVSDGTQERRQEPGNGEKAPQRGPVGGQAENPPDPQREGTGNPA